MTVIWRFFVIKFKNNFKRLETELFDYDIQCGSHTEGGVRPKKYLLVLDDGAKVEAQSLNNVDDEYQKVPYGLVFSEYFV